MPRYTIALISPDNKPGESEIGEREERQFDNLGEALQRGREMYRQRESSSVGFRIYNVAGEVVHERKR
jgi:hypothetical protein